MVEKFVSFNSIVDYLNRDYQAGVQLLELSIL